MAEPFAMITLDALADNSLTPGTRILLAVLCCYAGKSRSCFPSATLLSEKTGSNRTRIFERLSILEEKGYIRREQRMGKASIIHVLKGIPERSLPVTKTGTGPDEVPVPETGTGGVTKTGTGTRTQNRDTENTNKKIPLNTPNLCSPRGTIQTDLLGEVDASGRGQGGSAGKQKF